MSATVQLDLPLVVPNIDSGDNRLDILTMELARRKGVKNPIVRENDAA